MTGTGNSRSGRDGLGDSDRPRFLSLRVSSSSDDSAEDRLGVFFLSEVDDFLEADRFLPSFLLDDDRLESDFFFFSEERSASLFLEGERFLSSFLLDEESPVSSPLDDERSLAFGSLVDEDLERERSVDFFFRESDVFDF